MRNSNFSTWFNDSIAALLIVLFVYAATSKLLDFQKFHVQLQQSPILTHFAGRIAWIVPFLEILISCMLAVPRLRMLGLYASFGLLVLFTVYIFFITTFSENVPCSCGGVIQNMSWHQHLIFNGVFILLNLTAILVQPAYSKKQLT